MPIIKQKYLLIVIAMLSLALSLSIFKNIKYLKLANSTMAEKIEMTQMISESNKLLVEYKNELQFTKLTLDSIVNISSTKSNNRIKHETVIEIIDPLSFLPPDSAVVEFSRSTKSKVLGRHSSNGSITEDKNCK